MAYKISKDGEITFYGWEKGIASSPFTGIADLKGFNISSFPGEVMVNYDRTRQTQFKSITNTLTASTSNTLIAAAGSGQNIGLLHGTWITINSSTFANHPANGATYYVKSSSGGNVQLSLTYEGSVVNNFDLTGSATFVVIPMGQPIAWAATSSSFFPDYQYFVLDSTGYVWVKNGASGIWEMIDTTAETGAGGIFCYGSYVFICAGGTTNALKYKSLGSLATGWASFKDLNHDSTGAPSPGHYSLVSHNSVVYICDGSFIDSLATVGGQTFDPTSGSTYTWTSKALLLPISDEATVIGEIGTGNQTTLLIGGLGSVLYPWDGLSTTYGALVYLPESFTRNLVTVNNLVYIFSGSKGNIYITNGSSVTTVIKVPDYIANNQGSNQDPYFIWGGAMYLRGRIWFSVKAPNCGGIWSFVPTNNYYIQNDVGAALRCDIINSYGTYSGYATILFLALAPTDQQALGAQYYAGWDDGTSGASTCPYGIDYSATTAYTGGSIIETDAVPTGTMLNKKTFSEIEYKLSAPLAASESVQLYYRLSLQDAFTSCGTVIVDTSGSDIVSGYFSVNFEKTQWLQIRAVLTAVANNSSFIPLREIMVR